jgi:hypothetical protein
MTTRPLLAPASPMAIIGTAPPALLSPPLLPLRLSLALPTLLRARALLLFLLLPAPLRLSRLLTLLLPWALDRLLPF